MNGQAVIDSDAIRALAHELWESRGRRAGCADQDWLDAERQLTMPVREVPKIATDDAPGG